MSVLQIYNLGLCDRSDTQRETKYLPFAFSTYLGPFLLVLLALPYSTNSFVAKCGQSNNKLNLQKSMTHLDCLNTLSLSEANNQPYITAFQNYYGLKMRIK